MALSVPGWFLAITIWGYNSGESALSDALIVSANTLVTASPKVCSYRLFKRWGVACQHEEQLCKVGMWRLLWNS
jgi:hypothetical protein